MQENVLKFVAMATTLERLEKEIRINSPWPNTYQVVKQLQLQPIYGPLDFVWDYPGEPER